MNFFAPAKINLNLKILGKRADGFHELETLMIPISLGDDLEITLGGTGIQLTCSDPALPCDNLNLAWRAAQAFLERHPIASGVRIHLEKRTPSGAGLGGGSSDAAAVLLALRTLSEKSSFISDAELASIASTLGSDVPFFIYNQPAICRGRGEIINPSPLRDRYEGVLLHPGFSVPTPWAYQTYAQKPHPGTPGKSTADTVLQNDLEPPVFSKYLWIPTVKEWFRRQSEVFEAMMSGSGSAVFALTHPQVDRRSLLSRFQEVFGTEPFSTLFEMKASTL